MLVAGREVAEIVTGKKSSRVIGRERSSRVSYVGKVVTE